MSMPTVLFYIFVFLFLHKWLFVYKIGNVVVTVG